MAAYYNEIDPFAAAWLRELMRIGMVADGEIDTRSIEDVEPTDVAGFSQCHFFAGIGTWSYALRLAGWDDDREIWTGSCPCQPFSRAGEQRGTADRRHLWPELYRIVRERRPAIIVGEQVAGPAGLAWWDVVSADLEDAGYAAAAANFCAASVGAPHIRQRLYWCGILPGRLDNAKRPRLEGHAGHGDGAAGRQNPLRSTAPAGPACRVADPDREQRQRPASEPVGAGLSQPANNGDVGGMVYPAGDGFQTGQRHHPPLGYGYPHDAAGSHDATAGFWRNTEWRYCRDGKYRPIKPGISPLVNGFTGRCAVLRCIGNAIVAPQAAAFIQTVMEAI